MCGFFHDGAAAAATVGERMGRDSIVIVALFR
jgi:hypothetical protein